MGVSFNKSGIIRGGVADSSSYSLCNFSIQYTPTAGVNNSCMDQHVSNMTENHTYVIAATISWYFASFPDNFGFWLQGPQHHKTNGWGWTTSGRPTEALTRVMVNDYSTHTLIAFAKSNPNYAKRVIAEFTVKENYDGYGVGCRCDYADGNSWVKMSDVIIVPKEYWVGDMKIYSDEIIADNFIEC